MATRGSSWRLPASHIDLRVVHGTALDHRGVVHKETVLDQNVGRGGEARRAAVVSRPVPLEDGFAYRSGTSCPCIESHILDVETTTASKREIVTEEASLDKQSFATFGIIGKPNAPSIAHPLFRFIVYLGNVRTSDIALKTAIDKTKVALDSSNCPSVIAQ